MLPNPNYQAVQPSVGAGRPFAKPASVKIDMIAIARG